jgi:hypothetical protein
MPTLRIPPSTKAIHSMPPTFAAMPTHGPTDLANHIRQSETVSRNHIRAAEMVADTVGGTVAVMVGGIFLTYP